MPLSLEETINYLGEQLDSNSLNFSEIEEATFQSCFDMIHSDVQTLQQEKEPIENLKNKINTKNQKLIDKTIYFLNEQFLTRSLSDNRVTFIKCMLEFIFNWNTNILNNKMVTSSCSVLYQSIEIFQHMNKTIQILQKTIQSYDDLKNWMPPAFDISKIYCDELFKQNE